MTKAERDQIIRATFTLRGVTRPMRRQHEQ